MKSEYFLGLKGKQVLHDIVAFDVEGCGGGGFVCGAIVSGATVNFFTDKEDMFQTILEYGLRGYWIFSHNLE
jgi:integral membrane sensor domain MASE1